MINAASARSSIRSRFGAIATGSITDWYVLFRKIVTDATDVRELVSMATVLMSRGSRRVYNATDFTGPFDVTPAPSTMPYGLGPRRYSIDGIRPRSISCACSRRAHSDGRS